MVSVSGKVFQILNHVGGTLGANASRGNVDRLAQKNDHEIKTWKTVVETAEAEAPQDPQRIHCRLTFSAKKHEHNLGYSVGWDNLQIEVYRKHQTSEKKNKFLMRALTFAVKHRLPSLHLRDERTVNAVDIDPVHFLPTVMDYEEFLRPRLSVIVSRILARHIAYLNPLQKQVEEFIPHEYVKEMTRKTTVVNLGVVEADPAATTGVIDIMSHIQSFVPELEDDKLHTVPCNGDQLSVPC